jgi:hypothetical protein
MTLIETFRNETAVSEAGSPLSDDSVPNINVLYFPAVLGCGKLQALPSAEEVEYPERDLADLLVGAQASQENSDIHLLLGASIL